MQSRDKVHEISIPKKIVVGPGVISRAGEYFKQTFTGKHSILIVVGPKVRELVYPALRESLEQESFTVYDVIVRDSSVDTAEKVAEIASEMDNVSVIAGLGGGRSIDIAKYAAKVSGKAFASIPTVASHDGITSPFASLRGFGKPISRAAKTPDLILIDVDIVQAAPRRYNMAGFGDLIGKFTSVRDWRLANRLRGEYYGEYAASLALLSARHVSAYYREIALGTREGLRVLLEALVSSGVAMGIAGSTRPASGSEHLFAHALSMIVKNPPLHGEMVGVGTIMMAYLHELNWKKIRLLLRKVGLPTTAEELGVSDDDIVEALVMAARIRPERYTILGERGLTREAAEQLARKTRVIGRR